MERAVTTVDQGEQLLAVEVSAILHLGPIVTEGHYGVIGSAKVMEDAILI